MKTRYSVLIIILITNNVIRFESLKSNLSSYRGQKSHRINILIVCESLCENRYAKEEQIRKEKNSK